MTKSFVRSTKYQCPACEQLFETREDALLHMYDAGLFDGGLIQYDPKYPEGSPSDEVRIDGNLGRGPGAD